MKKSSINNSFRNFQKTVFKRNLCTSNMLFPKAPRSDYYLLCIPKQYNTSCPKSVQDLK